MKIGVLGPGGVGGALAVRLARAGNEVVCIGTPLTVAAIRTNGLSLAWQGETISARPEAAEVLEDPVDLLLVTVKAPDLESALDRVFATPVLTLALLNGFEHIGVIREALNAPVAAGSIRVEAYVDEPGRIVQTSPFTLIRMASADAQLDDVAATLSAAGIETHVEDSERAVLWEKAARLAVLAPVTSIAQRPVSAVRADPEWRPTIEAAIAEACAVATADGAPATPADHWPIIDSLPEGLTTSAARDVAAGRPSEIDAITGAVVRAGRRLGVPTPTLDDLLDRCRRQ